MPQVLFNINEHSCWRLFEYYTLCYLTVAQMGLPIKKKWEGVILAFTRVVYIALFGRLQWLHCQGYKWSFVIGFFQEILERLAAT